MHVITNSNKKIHTIGHLVKRHCMVLYAWKNMLPTWIKLDADHNTIWTARGLSRQIITAPDGTGWFIKYICLFLSLILLCQKIIELVVPNVNLILTRRRIITRSYTLFICEKKKLSLIQRELLKKNTIVINIYIVSIWFITILLI